MQAGARLKPDRADCIRGRNDQVFSHLSRLPPIYVRRLQQSMKKPFAYRHEASQLNIGQTSCIARSVHRIINSFVIFLL